MPLLRRDPHDTTGLKASQVLNPGVPSCKSTGSRHRGDVKRLGRAGAFIDGIICGRVGGSFNRFLQIDWSGIGLIHSRVDDSGRQKQGVQCLFDGKFDATKGEMFIIGETG